MTVLSALAPSLRSGMAATSRPYIGGQAVLEGVMMRAPKSFAVVVRRRDGTLNVRERAIVEKPRAASKWPLLRGIASLVESLRLGGEALRFSAEKMERDLARDGALGVLSAFGLSLVAMATRDDEGVSAKERAHTTSSRFGTWIMLLVAIAFFVALPQGSAAALNRWLGLGLEVQSARFQAMTGAFKLAIVVGYLLAIRRVPDIRRVFQYHGAEHKTISTYEAGEELTLQSARAKTLLHPRCGTTFLVMVALVSILVFTAIGSLLPRIHTGTALADNLVFFVEKLPFLPVIASVTFELQRFFARFCTTGPLRVLLWPGFVVQKITTAEPDDRQLEVALASLRATLFRQEKGHTYAEDYDVEFASYADLLAADRLRVEARAH